MFDQHRADAAALPSGIYGELAEAGDVGAVVPRAAIRVGGTAERDRADQSSGVFGDPAFSLRDSPASSYRPGGEARYRMPRAAKGA